MTAKRMVSILLTALLLCMPLQAFAQNNAKDEVVYVLLDSAGAVRDVYIVNVYADHNSTLTDYGAYDSVRNLSTTDALAIEGDTVTGDIPNGRFYYEGKLPDARIPWNISVVYQLNGVTVDAAELAGASGKLEIVMNILPNPDANAAFYENYALQTSASFDTNKCANIAADGATVANVGENKNLSYTLLPGREAAYTIALDVTEFEMGGISFNAVPFSMNIEIDGVGDMTDAFAPLTDGIATLDDGAAELQSGATELRDGMNALNGNSDALVDGSSAVLDALGQMNDAVGGLDTNGISELVEGSSAVQSGLQQLTDGLGKIAEDTDQIQLLLKLASSSDNELVQNLLKLYNGKMDAVKQAAEASATLSGGYARLHTGIRGLSDGMGNVSKLSGAIRALYAQYQALDEGIVQYTQGLRDVVSGYGKLGDGIAELKSGTAELRDKTQSLDDEVSDKIREAIDDVVGETFKPVSFVSDKNDNVSSVQFVIKTDGVEIPKVEAVKEQPKKLSFWEKLAALFTT